MGCGDSVIDAQHRRLIGLINQLGEILDDNTCDPDDYHRILHEVNMFAREHFEYEEHLFDMTAYPDKDEHKRSHARYWEFLADVNLDSMGFITDRHRRTLFEFLTRWWTTHILVGDRDYAPYMMELK